MDAFQRLWDSIKYRYRCSGMVEKDGRAYKKYVKVRRFTPRHKRLVAGLMGAAVLLVLGMSLVKLLMEHVEQFPPEAVQEEAP